MAFGKATGIGGFTPTPVRGTGTTEKLASFRADDRDFTGADGPNLFERDVQRRFDYNARFPTRLAPKRNRTRR